MIVRYNSLNRFETPVFTLCQPGSTYSDGLLTKTIGALVDHEAEEIVFNFNALSELNLRVNMIPREDPEENDYVHSLYRAIQNRRLIYVEDIGYFVITNVSDGYDNNVNYKDITAKSIDAELQQKMIPYIADGTYRFSTDSVGEHKGIFETIVEVLPLWTIGHVDDSVAEKWRTFEDVNTSLNCFAFLIDNVQDAYECIIVFDITHRIINVYAQDNYVRLTDIHITKDDLINSIDIDENSDDIYTAISALGGDSVSIAAVNPLGTNVIYKFDYYLNWMSDTLKQKVSAWQAAVNSVFDEHYQLSQEYYQQLALVSNFEQDIEKINTRITMYGRCRDNIVAQSSTDIVGQYNTAIEESGGTAISIGKEIAETLAEIDKLIGDCKKSLSSTKTKLNTANKTLSAKKTSLDKIHNDLDILNYFSEDEYTELCLYIYEGSYNDEYVIITDSMSYADKFEQMKLLYDRAKSRLNKVSAPTQEFNIDVESFIFMKEFEEWCEQLETGCLINVELDVDDIAELFLASITVNYDDRSMKLTFGNRYNKFDPKTMFENALGNIAKSANTLNYVKEAIHPLKNGEFSAVQEALQTSRDLTMGAALAATNQEVVIDATGYTGKKFNQNTGDYDPKQIKIVNNSIVFTKDGWETCSLALGDIVLDPDDEENGTVYGVNAQVVCATVGHIGGWEITPNGLVHRGSNKRPAVFISSTGLQDADYTVGAYTGKDWSIWSNGKFGVTNSGALYATDVHLSGTINWDQTNKPSIDNVEGLREYLNDVKDELDGRAQTWYQDSDPSTQWATDKDKSLHIGDLWHYTGKTGVVNNVTRTKNSEWVWKNVNGVYQWVLIEISDEVFDAIDGKAQIFTSEPKPPYHFGDLWVQGSKGDIFHCVRERLSGTFDASDWQKSSKYTDDTELNNFMRGTYKDDLGNITSQLDKKAETWYQATDPSAAWITSELQEMHLGDLWHCTAAITSDTTVVRGKNSEWIWQKTTSNNATTYSWSPMDVPDEVFDKIDGIASIYVTIPDKPVVGDLLIPANDIVNDIGNFKAGKVYKYNGSEWIEIAYTDDTTAKAALEAAQKAINDAASALKDAEDSNSAVSTLNTAVGNYLGLGGNTLVDDRYVISPYIGGGFLNITKTNNNAKVIIDPNNLSGEDYIFQVYNGNNVSVGIKQDGSATFAGAIEATSLKLGAGVKISVDDIDGIEDYAKIGEIDGVPANVLTADDVEITSETLANGITKKTIQVGNYTYTSISDGGFILTDVGLGEYTGDGSKTYTKISTEGLLTAHNAMIYGTVYATAGRFTGDIVASSLTLGNGVTVSASNVSGLSEVATSGSYSDLSGKPTIPTSVAELGLEPSTIIYKGDITQTTKKDSNGVEYLETTVQTSDGKITYSTYKTDDYIVFGRGEKGDNFCISTDGLLEARNAVIYGKIFATEGEFTGDIVGGTININDCFNVYGNGNVTMGASNPNIFVGSKYFSSDRWKNLEKWNVSEETYEGKTVYTAYGTQPPITQYIYVESGTKYTFSAYVKCTSAFRFYTKYNYKDATATTDLKNEFEEYPATSEWKRVVVSFTATGSGMLTPLLRIHENDAAQMWICGMKIEKGERATDDDGTVQISAGNSDDSFITFGESFRVDNTGVSAAKGEFGLLTVGGKNVLTEGGLASNIVVSVDAPTQRGVIWIKPQSIQQISYSGETDDDFIHKISCISNDSRDFVVKCLSSDTFDTSSNIKYKYTIKFPVIIPYDNVSEKNVIFKVTATKSSNPDKKVVFTPYKLALIKGWGRAVIEMTAESNENLCDTSDDINLTFYAENCESYNSIYIDRYKNISFIVSNDSPSEDWQSCAVYYKP